MTPLGIEIMLHYHTRMSDYREGDFSAPAVRETLDRFRQDGLLVPASQADRTVHEDQRLAITARGRAYVEALCDTPLPVQKWVMPDRSMTEAAGE